MRGAYAALEYSKSHPTIPYYSISGIDGDARKVDDLECARSVMADYDVMPIDNMGSANQMWARTVDKRYGTPLIGALLHFPNSRPGSSGHVCLYAGDGMGWTTPIWLEGGTPYQGKHLASIAEIARLCGNAYVGWGADIAGMPIDFTPPPAPEQETSMDTSYIFDGRRYALIDPILDGGYSLTTDVKVAEGYSLRIHPSRGPVKTEVAKFDVAIAQAADTRKQYLADRVALGDVHVDQSDVVKALAAQAAAAAAQSKAVTDGLAALTAAVKANSAQGLSTSTISAIASKVTTAVKAALPKKITGTLE